MSSVRLIFVGIKGTALALQRETGAVVWETHLKGSEFVQVVVEGENLYATTGGEIFCLDPVSGGLRWHNPLKGYGVGLVSLAANNGPNLIDVVAETERRASQASSSDTIFIS